MKLLSLVSSALRPLNSIYRTAQISIRNRRFERWQRQNPAGRFSDYFAETKRDTLRLGRKHYTLGNNLKGGSFADSGLPTFKLLLENGLTTDSTCVDYGCGTLRVGFHIIRYLRRGAYWGLDLDESFLEVGRNLVGNELLGEKAPNLFVISPEAISNAAAVRPDLLLSNSVLIHVHPDELAEYLKNIITIIGDTGRAVVTGKWSPSDTIRFSGQSWAHSVIELDQLASRLGARLSPIREQEMRLDPLGLPLKTGALLITPI
jgi:SAM-dependent methyltransferase